MPALAPVVDSLDTVPEPARGFYEAKDGKFVLSLNGTPAGYVPAAEHAATLGKVVEFRDNNIRLTQEVTELRPLKTQFEGIDPTAAREALTKVADLGKKGVKGADDVAALVAASVEAAIKPLKDQLQTQTQQTEAERKRADESVLRSSVTEKFLKAGGKAKAVDYILNAAKEAFTVESGTVKALSTKFSTERPGEPLGMDEWLTSMAREHDFAFEGSTGSGAAPVSGVRGTSTVRAGQTILKDPTPQELGAHSKDIAQGKMRVEYSK